MKWLSHPLVVTLISLVAILAVVSLRRGEMVSRESGVQVAQLKAEVERLDAQKSQLQADLQRAESPLAQERMIRDQLLMQKEGEYIVQLVDDPRMKETVVPPEATPTPLEAWKKLVSGD